MLSLLSLLGDTGRGLNLELPESVASAASPGEFEALFAAAGEMLHPLPQAPTTEIADQSVEQIVDHELGSPLPPLPAERQPVADSNAAGLPGLGRPVPEAANHEGRALAAGYAAERGAGDPATAVRAAAGVVPAAAHGTAAAVQAADRGAGERPQTMVLPKHSTSRPGALSGQGAPNLEARASAPPAPDRVHVLPSADDRSTQAVASGRVFTTGISAEAVAGMGGDRPHAAAPAAELARPDATRAVPAQPAPETRLETRGAEHDGDRPANPRDGNGQVLPANLRTALMREQPVATPPQPERAPAGGVAALPAALPGHAARPGRGPANENLMSERDMSRAGADLLPARADRGLPGESLRVRQAAETVRRLSNAAALADKPAADAASAPRHAPGLTPTPVPAPASTTGVTGGEAQTLSLADSQAAAEQLVQRVLQGQARQMSSLRLQLSPAELGQLQVHLQRRGDRLDIAFTASQAGARDLIEACLPHLRALLQDAGLQLADVDVRHEPAARDLARGAGHSAQHQSGGGNDDSGRNSGGREGVPPAVAADLSTGDLDAPDDRVPQPASAGGIDAFA